MATTTRESSRTDARTIARPSTPVSRTSSSSGSSSKMSNIYSLLSQPKAPVYFLSHGGPYMQWQPDHPIYPTLEARGREMTERVKPTGVVVVTGHWKGTANEVHVNDAEQSGIIYDIPDFPHEQHKIQRPYKGSRTLADRIIRLLKDAGIQASARARGHDEGVYSSYSIAFHPETNPLDVPLVQVSLFDNNSLNAHYNLGRALSKLREEGVLILCQGMTVFNIREQHLLRWCVGGEVEVGPFPWVVTFDEALTRAVEAPPAQRHAMMKALMKRFEADDAHPTWDRLLPLFVAAGAAGDDYGVRLETFRETSFAYGNFRFGDIPPA